MLVVFYPSLYVVLKKLKQEVLLDQFCLHLAKWSIVLRASLMIQVI